MQTETTYEHNRTLRPRNAASISISTDVRTVIEPEPYRRDSLHEQQKAIPPVLKNLFENAINAPQTIPERFPRLTFLAVAVSILVTALVAELDYLHGAGYMWP